MQNWKLLAPMGLILIGTGFSLAAEATLWKGNDIPWPQWVGLGTLGLSVFNAGIAVFGEAVKHSTLAAWQSKENE